MEGTWCKKGRKQEMKDAKESGMGIERKIKRNGTK